ncbi:hypothetical protein BATDEDRAFT_85580 [Batrachochytrium dendrobatidis JAM81]|uniref:carnosine N-methyltransferase n=2 Tax=Batrachochytrium dendrobatidis TaxID=109871 RepID=F4NSL3_BATDJ|nr:uncharacterized protein BATDEDRAFT_85580 [Batrachochytrium dendrobatidis JAM81]EGF83839.1 hypothetical protein BATDEDRAFT_85580 [Batrachochytrium dendrobatidis JAM81]|eukprot:XP_006676241.1 hypothetical protein BATDEDRAFT_85580 [Batrachochytrium dendrobatidis JAM81]
MDHSSIHRLNDDDLLQEQQHLAQVVATYNAYRRSSILVLEHKIAAIPQKPLYDQVRARLHSHIHCINHNAHLLNLITSEHQNEFLQSLLPDNGQKDETDQHNKQSNKQSNKQLDKQSNDHSQKYTQLQLKVSDDYHITEGDLSKVQSTIRQFVRDWSEEGRVERTNVYGPILDFMNLYYAHVPLQERGEIHVLIPGSGLGRLVFETVANGFSCQGNEFSMYMLLASNFILNMPERAHEFTIYPWIHSFSNIPSAANQLQAIQIPDILVSDHVPPTVSFSMVAGDFIQIYGAPNQKDQWDVVATCFFIDTAKDLTQYLAVIKHALKPKGIWINVGPLLYHFEGNADAVEFTLEEVKHLITEFGFVIQVE